MFRNRGPVPNITLPNQDGDNDNDGFEIWPRQYIVVYYDKKFILMEIIVILAFIIFGFSLYLWVYK